MIQSSEESAPSVLVAQRKAGDRIQRGDQRSKREGYDVSVVVPARNEEGTIADVVRNSFAAFGELGYSGEVLVVDDGSTDGTNELLLELQRQHKQLTVFTNRRSLGMTAALRTMFAASRGDVVILIPGDMESDPAVDVPILTHAMDERGLDVVAGWRQGRQDRKVFASGIYNWVMRSMAGVPVHDANWIKAMRREVVDSFPPLRSDWHRFLLMIAVHMGYSVGEVATPYTPRPSGSSKFGWERIPISFLDVLVVKFLLTFSQAPMRFFGGIGLLGMFVGLLVFVFLTVLYIATNTQQRPIFIAAGGLVIISVLLILVGFLAELIVSQGERLTALEQKIAERERKDS